MDRTELAWASGFFDAEGWVARSGRGVQARINQADAEAMPEVLERFRAAVGVGRLGGPDDAPGKLPLYHWIASSREDLHATFKRVDPWLGEVKRKQFEDTLGVIAVSAVAPTADEFRAWAAGLFDGDGSTCFAKHRTHIGYRTADAAITQSSSQGVPEVLTRFRSVVGAVGRVYGPYAAGENWEPVYRYKALRLADVEQVIRTIWPWLGSVKRAQAMCVLAVVKSQPVLPRGNPAWGNRKTHCVNGHEYATARLRPFRGRGKSTAARRDSKQCLACVRECARTRRLQAKKRSEDLGAVVTY